MSALMIPDNRIAVALEGRQYPFAVTRKMSLPEVFHPLPAMVYSRLPFKGFGSKTTLFQRYAESIDAFKRMAGETNLLFKAIAEAGGFPDTYELELETAPPAKAELYAKKPREIAEMMGAMLTGIAGNFVIQLVNALDELVCHEQVGIITWTCKDACRYHYFLLRDETTQTGGRSRTTEATEEFMTGTPHVDSHMHRRRTATTTTERDFERVKTVTRHVHDLINAKVHPPTAPIPRPKRAQAVIKAIPKWLFPLVRIVDGNQIRDLRIEREISRKEWSENDTNVRVLEESSYRYDPAVIVGHYVLVGWDGEEAKRDPIRR